MENDDALDSLIFGIYGLIFSIIYLVLQIHVGCSILPIPALYIILFFPISGFILGIISLIFGRFGLKMKTGRHVAHFGICLGFLAIIFNIGSSMTGTLC